MSAVGEDGIAWGVVEQALVDWVKAGTGFDQQSVIWEGAPIEPTLPYAALSILSGPRELGMPEQRKIAQVMRDEVEVVAAAEQTYTISIDDVLEASHPAGAGESLTQIRDALLALLTPDDLTVSALSTTKIQVDGTAARPHFHTIGSPSADLVRTTVNEAIHYASYTPNEMTVRVKIVTNDAKPSGHARRYAKLLRDRTGLPSVATILRAAGLSDRGVVAGIDLSGFTGPTHRTMYSLDVVFGIASEVREQSEWIRTIEVQHPQTLGV